MISRTSLLLTPIATHFFSYERARPQFGHVLNQQSLLGSEPYLSIRSPATIETIEHLPYLFFRYYGFLYLTTSKLQLVSKIRYLCLDQLLKRHKFF